MNGKTGANEAVEIVPLSLFPKCFAQFIFSNF
jgi:hypothetical protein